MSLQNDTMETIFLSLFFRRQNYHVMNIWFPYLKWLAMSLVDKSMSEAIWCSERAINLWPLKITESTKDEKVKLDDELTTTARKTKLNSLARSFYPNLVKDKNVPASADADPDALTLHAVRQQIQAFHQRPNKLTDDAITLGHQGKMARLSLFVERKRERNDYWFQQLHENFQQRSVTRDLQNCR